MLLNRYDTLDLRHFFLEMPFDAHFQRHSRARATPASTLKTDTDFARGFVHVDKFYIASVRLKHRADTVYYRLNLSFQRIVCFSRFCHFLDVSFGLMEQASSFQQLLTAGSSATDGPKYTTNANEGKAVFAEASK